MSCTATPSVFSDIGTFSTTFVCGLEVFASHGGHETFVAVASGCQSLTELSVNFLPAPSPCLSKLTAEVDMSAAWQLKTQPSVCGTLQSTLFREPSVDPTPFGVALWSFVVITTARIPGAATWTDAASVTALGISNTCYP